MANKDKEKKDNSGFKEYSTKNFIWGFTITLMLNIVLGVIMKDAFGFIGVIGIFFLSENVFILNLVSNQNYKNIMYLKDELEKLRKELQKVKKALKKC